jgi:hypothetical protein
MQQSAEGPWSIDPGKSETFSLCGRDQQALRRLHARLHFFFREHGIEQLFLRKAECARGYAAKVETYLCEGVLCLTPGVVVHQISALSLSHWMRANDCEPGRQANDRAWHYAVAAALYLASGAGEETGEIGSRA